MTYRTTAPSTADHCLRCASTPLRRPVVENPHCCTRRSCSHHHAEIHGCTSFVHELSGQPYIHEHESMAVANCAELPESMAITPSSSFIITLPSLLLVSKTPPLHRRSAFVLRSFESLRVATSLKPALRQLDSLRNNHHELTESLAEHHQPLLLSFTVRETKIMWCNAEPLPFAGLWFAKRTLR